MVSPRKMHLLIASTGEDKEETSYQILSEPYRTTCQRCLVGCKWVDDVQLGCTKTLT